MGKICCVYKITSKVHPERYYIGSSINVRHRWIEHKSLLASNKHHSRKLQRHYNKYGIDDFIFEILEYCIPDNIISREQHYLDTLDPWPWFNTLPTAGSSFGYKLSPETREKIRENLLGRPCSPKTRERISKSNMGKKLTEEHKEKLREAHTGKKLTEEHKIKIGLAGLGRANSPESCKKISETLMGHPVSDATREKIRLNNGVNIMVINIETGIAYDSIAEAARSCNIPHATLSGRMNRAKHKTPFRRVSDYEDH